MPLQQRIIHFAGNVQGVGFRYTSCRAAGNYDITGYVRNLPDGQVQCVVEGDQKEIDAFVSSLKTSMGNCIYRVQQQDAPYTGQFGSFTVKY